jgi:ATP-dependent DNA helicase RecG
MTVMTYNNNIHTILQQGEGLHVEFKTSFNEDTIETLVAFSNAKGGVVYVGITDKNVVKGIQIGKETVQHWINEVKNKTAPQIIPDIEVIETDSKSVVSLIVQEYPIKPVSTKGRFYKRIGNSNHLLSVSEVSNMHLQTVNTSWDYYPRPGKSLKDISFDKVQKVMNIIMKRNDNIIFESPIEFLTKNEMLLEGNRITNGCFLMFSYDDNLFTTIQLGHFASEIVIKDDVTNSTDVLSQIDDIMAFIRKHINKEIIITATQIENIERWQYPLDAIRELVMNMIIHRDYTASSNSIIKIFSDHILFFNPGNLPDSITIENLLTNNYVSTPRNRQIAKTVKEMGLIERYGTGIKRVRKMFIDYGLPEPIYETIPGGFAVTVFANVSGNYNVNDTVKDTVNEPVNEPVNELVNEPVNERQEVILSLIKKNKNISINELSTLCKVGRETIKRDLNKLKQINLVERIGSDKSGFWKVIENEK